MSVTESFTLPNQPGGGSISRAPLGGDGFSAPIAEYRLQDVSLAGDASGGSARITVILDKRFCSLTSHLELSIIQATDADADIAWQISGGGKNVVATAISGTVHARTIRDEWFPPALILGGDNSDPILQVTVLNNNNDTYFLGGIIYLFDIRVRELMPIGPLNWARGSVTT